MVWVFVLFWVKLGVIHYPQSYIRELQQARERLLLTELFKVEEGSSQKEQNPVGYKWIKKNYIFLFILQKCKQVSEMVSYTFLHPSAVKTLFIHQFYSKMYILVF